MYANSSHNTAKTIIHITLGVTGGSQFALFITVNVVITFIAIFDGLIILNALATDWFDVSGFYLSFWDSVENFLDLPKCKDFISFSFFSVQVAQVFDIFPWHGENMLFYKCVILVRQAVE